MVVNCPSNVPLDTKHLGNKSVCLSVCIIVQEEARSTITTMLDQLQFGRAEPVVRVNSVGSGLAEEDLRVTLSAKTLPKSLMLPKVEDVDHIRWVNPRNLLLSDH